jgi:O-acetyl-ADP-ribose deacetylase
VFGAHVRNFRPLGQWSVGRCGPTAAIVWFTRPLVTRFAARPLHAGAEPHGSPAAQGAHDGSSPDHTTASLTPSVGATTSCARGFVQNGRSGGRLSFIRSRAPWGSERTALKIELVRGDITERPLDAIVNAANTWLIPGGGVDGAIHRAGGPTILEACKRLISDKYPGGLTTGQAVATTAGRLPAKWVIHAVGPIYSKMVDRSEQLIAAYRSALRVADDVGAKTIAFPAISTGAYAYPPDEAARLAVEALQFAKTRVNYAEFALLDLSLFHAFMNAMFDNEQVPRSLSADTDA